MPHYAPWLQLTRWCVELTKLSKSEPHPKKKSKGRTLAMLLLLILCSFIVAGQTWYEVTVSPNDEIVVLKNFDGYTAYSWLSPMLLVCLATVSVAALISRTGSRIVLAVGLFTSCLLSVFGANAVFNRDLGGVAKQLESSTGIAASHGFSGLEIKTTLSAYLGLTLFLLATAVFLYCLIAQNSWAIRASVNRAQASKKSSKSQPKDSIAIWDHQR